MRNNQFAVEIHTHTNHSDAPFTVNQLIDSASEFGYDGIVMTDHNTSSGFKMASNHQKVTAGQLVVLPGIEWTTYHGHMLIHDPDRDIDWRNARINNIDRYTREIKEVNGLIGIAHPFAVGSPFCTGCYWEFNIRNFDDIDYIEVWNSNQPQHTIESQKAFDWWLSLIDQGERISASTGRDWHRPDGPEENMGVTYLEIEGDLTGESFKRALALGHFYITLGPKLKFQFNHYQMGDTMSLSDCEKASFVVEVLPTEIHDLQPFVTKDWTVKIWNNHTCLYESPLQKELTQRMIFESDVSHPLNEGYVRVELIGTYRNQENTRIVIGNPIYITH